ncbi:hypothetical protein MRB53_015392 [Persea americana]|uniref:Uncharacterized protein n=1 Tax=Persea americana TaxID=3435 RepID=A0ACC2KDW1_PERAE|nr:hypothetical protein MRB53_015392 [Persea americana]
MYADTLNWRQSALTSISPNEQDASPDSSKIFPVSSSHQFVNSNGTALKASVRISMKTNQAVARSENKDSAIVYGENEYKKTKLSNDSSSQEQIPRERLLSKINPAAIEGTVRLKSNRAAFSISLAIATLGVGAAAAADLMDLRTLFLMLGIEI